LKKGFISLEYILIFCALLVIFSVFLITVDGLYKKNLSVIDTKNLINTYTEIQDRISFQELQTTSLYEIQIRPNNCWHLIKKSSYEIIIENENISKNIFSRIKINMNDIEICSKKTLVLSKKENQIYLYLE
jgi:uncharacterized protein (UPF0333 family)